MLPPPAKKPQQKQASLLFFFGGVKDLKKGRGGGNDDGEGNGHCSVGAGENIIINDGVNITASSSSMSLPVKNPPTAGIEETNSADENNEQKDHHSSSVSPHKGIDDDVCTIAELVVAVSPTGSMADESATLTTDRNAATIGNPTMEDGVVISRKEDDADCTNDEEQDDNSSCTAPSSCFDNEVKDENDAVAHNVNRDGKSAYELLREKNIARNNARLRELGLLVGVDAKQFSDQPKQQRKPPKRGRTNSTIEQTLLPARRSRRLEKNVATTSTSLDDGIMDMSDPMTRSLEPEEKNLEEREQCSVSPLLEYQMTITHHHEETLAVRNTAIDCEWTGIASLVLSNSRLIPPSGLNAIYSLQFYPTHYVVGGGVGGGIGESTCSSPWLVGAGKSGIIALWDCSNNHKDGCNNIDPVISWKGHGGRWIADAYFLPPPPTTTDGDDGCSIWRGGSVPSRLLTAGNDGTVCHWDLTSTSVKTGIPKLLNQSTKALHASGIFSMDVSSCSTSEFFSCDIRIVTGSKDKTIAVSSLDRLDTGPLWRSDFHKAKVGSVNFSSVVAHGDIPLIASASDDGLVAIHDAGNNCTVAQLEDIHFKPHSAVWMPGSAQIFITAGLDEYIKLWDLRNIKSPIACYHGHVPGCGTKLKRIHRPTFLLSETSTASFPDSFILSSGEGSNAISMFQVNKSEERSSSLQSVFSRGSFPVDVGNVGSLAVSGRNVAVATDGGELLLLSPRV